MLGKLDVRTSFPGARDKNTLNVRAEADAAEIDVFGVIGDWGLKAGDFRRALGSINAPKITVNINSPGGNVFDGVAIHNLLVDHPAEITVRVIALAASAASVVAMAGDTVEMGAGSFLMIHNSWAIAIGDTREMARLSRTLAQIDKELAKMYADRTGIELETIKDMMDEETWLDADTAIEQGFATGEIGDEIAPDGAEASFDLSGYRNIPRALTVTKRSEKKKAETPDFSQLLNALNSLSSTISKKEVAA